MNRRDFLEQVGIRMTKLADTLAAHPEMSAIDVTRIEVRKVADPTLRAALEAVVDLVEHHMRPSITIRQDAP